MSISSELSATNDVLQTSEFESISIYNALSRIGNQTQPLYLPAIQRHFVWEMRQICALFDSIMRGYPIGTFLFWKIDDDKRNDYAFYEFNRDYSKHVSGRFNRTAPRSLPSGIVGVLDGQQRLNSMYVAILGSYSEFIGGKGKHKSKTENYPTRIFHVNVAYEPIADEKDKVIFKFAFLTPSEASPARFDDKTCWFPIHLIYYCDSSEAVATAWQKFTLSFPNTFSISPAQSDRAFKTLDLLRRRLREEKLITYFPIEHRDLTEALQIFIRANNGGTAISNADMIFSTIIAHWPAGREKIEQFTSTINQIGNGFQFAINQIMLACLVLSGCPVRLRIESFKPAHVETISADWARITGAMRQAAQMISDWGLSGNNAVSPNVIIALAVLLKAGVQTDRSNGPLRLFVLKSIVCDLYRRHERALSVIREYADSHLHEGAPFNLEHFESVFVLPSGQRMVVNSDFLEQLLMLQIGDPRTYVLLSLLHGQHALHQQAFQKDHIHPQSAFNNLAPYNLPWERQKKWHDLKNRLPNLQLLQDGENNDKRAKPFKTWLPLYRPNEEARAAYLAENDIPATVSLEFADFEAFFDQRKARLRERLMSLLGVPPLPQAFPSNTVSP